MLPIRKGRGGGKEPGAGRQSDAHRGAQSWEETRQGLGVQEWRDGSRYEGEFVNGLKHGKGRHTWSNGEFYEGSFYKDYRHGDGLYCWPTGHKFIGKFYLNRKEGYGRHLFPDGATFQGLYHIDQRLGPGVVSYPDGCEDVGLWIGKRLLRLCTSVKEGFSLKNFPEYASYMDPAATSDSLTQPPASGLQTEARTDSEVHMDKDLQLDDDFILPPGIEYYSTNGDFLPLPPDRRRELDRLFFGELWEPDPNPYRGYKRDPLSTLPIQARMQANIHNHRLQADTAGWDVAAVLSLNRESFGPKGPLEVSSELLIQHASRGDRQAMLQILKTGSVHPDVADSQGHTALIAATVNCQNEAIHLLLDVGADINKLNCEGMSALAVCHVLYYPYQSLHTTLAETRAKTQVLGSPSACGNSLQISQEDFTTDTPRTAEEQTEHVVHQNRQTKTERGESEDENERRCENEEKGKEREFKEGELGGRKETSKENMEAREEDEEDVKERDESGSEDVPAVERCIQVLDGHIVVGSVQWKDCRATATGRVQRGKDQDLTQEPDFDSACAVSNYSINVTEEMMQRAAEALSHTGIPQRSDTQETVRKMAAMITEHRVRLSTLKLLLERGADPNTTRVPMPVLFLAIMADDSEAVRRLLLCRARTDIPLPPERKGLYPLHVAAALPGSAGPRITELLLCAITDPDAQACDQNEIYEPDRMRAEEPLSTTESPHLKEGGRTALHVACQRDSDYQNVSKVVALLLSHRARTDLLWSGHSPLSLAIASGNNLAVEELLKGGADPNIPLGHRVGSALCALANINYHLGGNRTELLGMLAEAGANILMPVMVGDVLGTAVSYAHHSFNQDLRIANTPFQDLNMRERETLKARRELLNKMGELLRKTAGQREKEKNAMLKSANRAEFGASSSNMPRCGTEKHRKPELYFCNHCGRSVSVKLTVCRHCQKWNSSKVNKMENYSCN